MSKCIKCGEDAPHTPPFCSKHWCEDWDKKVEENHPDYQQAMRNVTYAFLCYSLKWETPERSAEAEKILREEFGLTDSEIEAKKGLPLWDDTLK